MKYLETTTNIITGFCFSTIIQTDCLMSFPMLVTVWDTVNVHWKTGLISDVRVSFA